MSRLECAVGATSQTTYSLTLAKTQTNTSTVWAVTSHGTTEEMMN